MLWADTSSSALGGKKLPFQTASGLTRVLVLKASDTCDAISDRRGPLTWPKPSARALGLLMTVSMASCRRRVSSATLMMPSRALTSSMAAAGLADHVLGALGERRQKGFDGGRVFLDELGRGDDGVAVQLDAKAG